jgi:membrane protease YdiL (CAAX protease family)
MALALAFLYDRTGSIVPGIVAHGLNNAVALVLVYSRVAA